VVVFKEGELYGGGEEVTADASTVDIDGLEEGTRYTFRVAALTAGGWGPASAASQEIKTRGRKPRSATFVKKNTFCVCYFMFF
jgi:hypothetical protein